MKKNIFLIVLLTGMNALAFTQTENWTSIGFEFGNLFEKYPEKELHYLGAPGLNVYTYQFYDRKNIGLFFHFSALFPVIEEVEKNDNFNYLLQYFWLFGPGFRHTINDALTMYFGIGLNITWPILAEYSKDSIDYQLDANNLGIGADIGLKYDFTSKLYVNFGFTLVYDFINSTTIYAFSDDKKVRTKIAEDGYIMSYSMIAIKPYIGIGINVYGEKYKYGKPPVN